MALSMNLQILLPFRVLCETSGVLRIVFETADGSFGLLPNRLDCVAALVPGILVYETSAEGEVYVATDYGLLVKSGPDVVVSVRRAKCGADLEQLRLAKDQEFLTLSEQEQAAHQLLAKLETGFLKRFVRLKQDG